MRRISAIVATVAAALAVVAPAAHAQAQGGGANNVVLVSTTADGSSAARANLQTALFAGDTLMSSNIANAQAHDCTGCRSVAVAVQAVFNSGGASMFAPTNAALVQNTNCQSCESFAFAYQYVLTTPGPVRLSPAGQQEIATLRQEMADAAASGLPFDDLDARLDQLAAEFKTDVDSELQAAGQPALGTARTQVTKASGPAALANASP